MFTHINEYLNMVGYLFTYFIFISTNDVKLVLNYIYDSIVRIRIHACLLGMPTTHRTNDYTTPSLALTNGSTFGDFYYYYSILLHIQLTNIYIIPSYIIKYVRKFGTRKPVHW